MSRFRPALFVLSAVAMALIARPVAHVAHTAWTDAAPAPRAQAAGFASDAGSGTDLLNITVRDVAADTTTVLRHADRDMFCLVPLFHVADEPAAEARLQQVGERLVDAALTAGGRYYLPCRLYARSDPFERAYPQVAQFFAAKRRYDPDGLFSNELYRRYGSAH